MAGTQVATKEQARVIQTMAEDHMGICDICDICGNVVWGVHPSEVSGFCEICNTYTARGADYYNEYPEKIPAKILAEYGN